MASAKKRARKAPEAQHELVAEIRSSNFSYTVLRHGPDEIRDAAGSEVMDEEAIITIQAEIIETTPTRPQDIGEHIECSLISARRFKGASHDRNAEAPTLFPIQLRQDRRSILAYLSGDVFWGLQASRPIQSD